MKIKVLAAAAVLAVSGAASAQTTYFTDFISTTGLFTEPYTFTLSGLSNLMGGAAIDGGVTALGVSLTSTSPSFFGSDTNAVNGFSFTNLAAGTYSLQFFGNSTGPGSIGGSFTISPVPEPETYAMMLAGLGIMGFMAARRRQG